MTYLSRADSNLFPFESRGMKYRLILFFHSHGRATAADIPGNGVYLGNTDHLDGFFADGFRRFFQIEFLGDGNDKNEIRF